MKSTSCTHEASTRGTVSQFIQERKYLKNVSPKTLAWYRNAFAAFDGCETVEAINGRIIELRSRGVAAISVNSWLGCMNAYFRWRGDAIAIPKLKQEQKVLSTLTPEQVRRLIGFKPSGINETRVHMVALLVLDGGYRISEVLQLPTEHCDFDNLMVKVRGKGNKHRLVPMSITMRKVLYRYASRRAQGQLIFGTRNNSPVSVRNFERDLKVVGHRLGIEGVRFSPHTLRHTFAVSYLRNGGNLFYLSKILGHSTIKTTERYLQSLQVTDFQAVHDKLSPLTRY